MRRKDREVGDFSEILHIIDQCKVCRIALADGDAPYILPLNFGYAADNRALTVYFHSARAGKKIGLIEKNPRACFEVDCEHALVPGETACDYGFRFASVIGTGVAEIITDTDEAIFGLSRLMRHQTGRDFPISPAMLASVVVWKVTLTRVSGKRRGAKS